MQRWPLVEDSTFSSPQSNGSDSHRGTPGTKLTEFSPEVSRNKQAQRPCSGTQLSQPPAFALGTQGGLSSSSFKITKPNEPDPFTSGKVGPHATRIQPGQKLSARAASFKPLASGTTQGYQSIHNRGLSTELIHGKPAQPYPAFASGDAGDGENTNIPPGRYNLHPSLATSVTFPQVGSQATQLLQLANNAGPTPLADEFSGNRSTRYLRIAGIPPSIGVEGLNNAIKGVTFGLPNTVVMSQIDQGVVLLGFSDIRDAWKAAFELPRTRQGWTIEFARPREFVRTFKPTDETITSNCEGQLAVSAYFKGLKNQFDADCITLLLGDLARAYGDVLAQQILCKAFPTVRIRLEYFDSATSARVKKLHGLAIGEIVLSVEGFEPDLAWDRSKTAKTDEPLIIGQDDDEVETLVGGVTLTDMSNSPSPTKYLESAKSVTGEALRSFTPRNCVSGRLHSPLGSFSPHPQLSPFRLPLGSGHRADFHALQALLHPPFGVSTAIGHTDPTTPAGSPLYERRRRSTGNGPNNNNKVDIEKIRRGEDVRTTVMLRNIPNKMDQATLKETVDETNRGEYDFMYLRIDFANNCNVGYAFINFVDPLAIIPFYQARAGRRWNKYRSHKEAEVSYATIQGKDCLVQKFRNSSVMLEHPSFRPKVFHTGMGPLAGEEDSFPEPDNRSKMRRSVENAAQVGLFAPRAGQHFRDEQRRRRSQFDRGTRLAEMDDPLKFGSHVHNNLHVPLGMTSTSVTPGYAYKA